MCPDTRCDGGHAGTQQHTKLDALNDRSTNTKRAERRQQREAAKRGWRAESSQPAASHSRCLDSKHNLHHRHIYHLLSSVIKAHTSLWKYRNTNDLWLVSLLLE